MINHRADWAEEDNLEVRTASVGPVYRGFLSIDCYNLVVPRFDGSASTVRRELLDPGRSVCVLPYDPRSDRVLLIRQFLVGSYVAGRASCPLQVVAGIVDAAENVEAAARRETREEAACEMNRVILAQTFLPSPGRSSEYVSAFCGEADLSKAGGTYGLPEEGEDTRVEIVDAATAIDYLDTRRIESGFAVIMLSWFARHRDAVRREWSI